MTRSENSRNSAFAFVGGKVWTPGFSGSRALDVLVRDELIVEVAHAGELQEEDAVRIDLEGRLLVPGFQDAHVHPGIAGLDLGRCDLSEASTEAEVSATVSAYAKAHSDDEWILGGGWNLRVFADGNPGRQQLDALVGGRKAALTAHSRHAVWASSSALAAAGITAETKDPIGGRIERDHSGHPSGILHESAMELIQAVVPPPTVDELEEAVLRAQERLVALGVTSMQDALVGTGLGMPDFHQAYMNLLQGNDLKLRLTTALWWDPLRGVEQIADLLARRRELESLRGTDRVIADTVKMMVDGAGIIFLNSEQIREAVLALDAANFSIHFHSYGEASTRNILDAIEAARGVAPGTHHRHHIAHLMVIAPEEFARFARLNVTANIQGLWGNRPVFHDMLQPSQITQDPHTREYAFARLVAAGAHLAAGSDWPVSSADPLEALRVAANRTWAKHPQQPDELDRLDIASMLSAYTAGSAAVNGRAAMTGRIAPGFLADLVVLDEDLFDEESALANAAVCQTWIGGQQQYLASRARTQPERETTDD